MQFIKENKHFKFIPSSVIMVDESSKKQTFNNDIYNKYQASATIEGELIVCNDISKMRKSQKKIVKETYEEYLQVIKKRDNNKDKWIYNIIDGISEQASILYKDDKCIVIPSYMWNSCNVDKMHILCLPIDKSLRTIRSLDITHIPLLKHMKEVTCSVIKKKYKIDECYIKKFFHYEPSTYHLHIHFINVENVECESSVEYSHELDSVIFNLSICSNYYKQIVLNKRI
jgi:m7GpppX diphosphatase